MPGVYAESERRFTELTPRDFADWVVCAFPWRVANDGQTAESFRGEFFIPSLVWAPGDPDEPESRRIEGRGKFGHHEQYVELRRRAKRDPDAMKRLLLAHTGDGRPRSINRIGVEMFGRNASALPARVVDAIYGLAAERKLAFTVPEEGQFFMLFWNDAIWREGAAGRRASRPEQQVLPGF